MESQQLTGIAIRFLALCYAVKAFFSIPGAVGNYFISKDAIRMLPGDEAIAMAARVSTFAQLNIFLPFVMLLFSGVLLAKAGDLARFFSPVSFDVPSSGRVPMGPFLKGALCLLGMVFIGFSFEFLAGGLSTCMVSGGKMALLDTRGQVHFWTGCVTGTLYLFFGVGLIRYADGISRRFFPVG